MKELDEKRRKLTKMLEEMTRAGQKHSSMAGELKQLYSQMKEQFEVDNLKKAEKTLKETDAELGKMLKDLDKGLDELETKYSEALQHVEGR